MSTASSTATEGMSLHYMHEEKLTQPAAPPGKFEVILTAGGVVGTGTGTGTAPSESKE